MGMISDWIYLAVLFFLAAGRIHFFWGESFDVKIGENIENLLPVLLLARIVRRDFGFDWLIAGSRPILQPLGLILLGLLTAAVLHPTTDTFEDILRFLGQLLVGLLLAEWVLREERLKDKWLWAFLLGVLVLMARTPWRDLDDPNLEGPFPHRNVQAAFCLLSVPLLIDPFFRKPAWTSKQCLASLTAIAVMVLFIAMSRSRSGAIAILFACSLAPLVLPRVFQLSGKGARWILAGGAILALLLILISLVPRFRQFGQEVLDPYRRSRIPIWAAAVEGWNDPTQLLFGIGMEDSFDRILLDTPQGNLNYRYRKAHYPHGLYLQWLYWGGITALLGWLALVLSIARGMFAKVPTPQRFLCGAFLLAYFVLEIFESAFRDPRVAALFWMVTSLFFARGTEEEKPDDG